jgi:thiamine pyrophosphokinase
LPAQIPLAVVVADGDVPGLDQLGDDVRAAARTAFVIAADGGLRKARAIGLEPAVVIGDGDSLGADVLAELRDSGAELEVQVHPVEKDESDTQLALLEAVRRGAERIVVLGALGGIRFDHSLANVLLLALPELHERDVALVDATTIVRLLDGEGRRVLSISGRAGDLVSLLPLTEHVGGVRTRGLRYALSGETLRQGPARGLSNVLDGSAATIEIDAGRLAIVHTRAGAPA